MKVFLAVLMLMANFAVYGQSIQRNSTTTNLVPLVPLTMVLPTAYNLTFTNGNIRYLDATNGSDSNTGATPALAKKTPDGMITNGIGATGYTYIWAPGFYQEGTNAEYILTNVAFIADPGTHWGCTNTNGVQVGHLFQFVTNCYLQGGVFDFSVPGISDPLCVRIGGNFIFKNNVIHGSRDCMFQSTGGPVQTNWEINCQWDSYGDVCLVGGVSAATSLLNVINSVNTAHTDPTYGQTAAGNFSHITVNSYGSVFQASGPSTTQGNSAVFLLNTSTINLWNTSLSASATDSTANFLVSGDVTETVNVWGHSYPDSLFSVGTLNQFTTAGTTFPAGQNITLDTYGNPYWSTNINAAVISNSSTGVSIALNASSTLGFLGAAFFTNAVTGIVGFGSTATTTGAITATGWTNISSVNIQGYWTATTGISVTNFDNAGTPWFTNTSLTGEDVLFILQPGAKIKAPSGLTGFYHAF